MKSIEYLLKAYGMAKESKCGHNKCTKCIWQELAWELRAFIILAVNAVYKLCTCMYVCFWSRCIKIQHVIKSQNINLAETD